MNEIESVAIYVPKSCMFWCCVYWVLVAGMTDVFRALRIERPSPQTLAQSALGTIHVIANLAFSGMFWTINWSDMALAPLADYGIGCSMSYFLVDLCLIFMVDVKKQWPYLVHHVIAIFIGGCMSKGIIALEDTTNYMSMIEFSNLFLSTWLILKDIKLQPWYDRISVLLAATYVPARTVGLTYVSYRLLANLRVSDALTATLYAAVLFIWAISVSFSIKVAKIGWSKGLVHFCSFESLSYIVKAYLQLYLALHHIPHFRRGRSLAYGLVLVDLVHIAASLRYWSSWHRSGRTSELDAALDFAATQTKIVTNGLCIFFSAATGAQKLWTLATVANVLLLVRHLAICRQRAVDAFEVRDSRPFMAHFALSAIVPLFLSRDAPHLSILSYLIGGITWAVGLNPGILHCAVIVGDLALLNWFNR